MAQLLLLGRATKDAESLTSKEGKNYTRFSIAVNNYINGEEETSFFTALIFNKTAETAAEKIKKGDLVMVDGKPEIDAYLSNEGEAKATMKIIAERWKVLK